jgi:hypothetical protein
VVFSPSVRWPSSPTCKPGFIFGLCSIALLYGGFDFYPFHECIIVGHAWMRMDELNIAKDARTPHERTGHGLFATRPFQRFLYILLSLQLCFPSRHALRMNARTCRAFSNHGSLLRRVLPTVRYLSANTAVSYTVPPPPNNGAPSSPSLSHHIISSISGDSMPNHSNSIEPPVQSPPGRFDWRQRASSRRPPKQPEVNADGKRVYIKRIAAPSVDLQPGEAYYDEVQSYIAKCVSQTLNA